jgi:hypothetical protein
MVGQQLRDFVRERAKDQCEYCQLPHELESFLPFHVDHIVAEQHGCDDDPMNLCWCCQHCNLKKGPNLSSRDGITGQTVELFNPRTDKWSERFEWNGSLLVSNTPTGRATIRVWLSITRITSPSGKLSLQREFFLLGNSIDRIA